jgi:nucleotide-binding universal stress UspA family protein
MTTLEAGLFESGRPVLIAPPVPRPQMGTNVLIAWNCSTEQARATAFAMHILKRANRVVVLTVEGGAAVAGPTGEQLCRYLQLNEVPAKPLTVGLNGRLTGEVILAHASALGCDLLIKGAYTQSRLRQMIFGRTTRYILSNATGTHGTLIAPGDARRWGVGAYIEGVQAPRTSAKTIAEGR